MTSPFDSKDYTRVPAADIRAFETLCGPTSVTSQLKTIGELYRRSDEAPEHILLTGPDGIGKRTISRAFAKAYCSDLCEVKARDFKRLGDLTAILTSLESRQALLLLNLQDMRDAVANVLCRALQEFRVLLEIGQGPKARIHPFPLGRFTCIATATKESDVNSELLSCFSLRVPVRSYNNEETERLVRLLSGENGLNLGPEIVRQILSVCAGNPDRIAQQLRRFLRLGKKEPSLEEAAELLAASGSNSYLAGVKLSNIDGLSGTEFESIIARLLDRMGFSAEMTKASGDGGIDIVAHLDKPIVGGRYLIQCKRFDVSSQVGAPLIREFYGALVADRKAVKGIFITTSGFTAQAREFALTLPLELIDGNQLRILLED